MVINGGDLVVIYGINLMVINGGDLMRIDGAN